MNAEKSGHVIKVSFDGVDDLMATAKRYKKFSTVARKFDECFTDKNDWNGHHTMNMVVGELLEPTPKMADMIGSSDALFDSEDWATEKPKRKIKRRLEDGDEIDIDRWMDREPDMWEESKKVKGPRFGVRIGVNVATSGYVDEDGFKWRTSAVMAILSICEELVIPCEVMCYHDVTGYARMGGVNYGRMTKFPVKRPEHNMDIDLLGYVLGNRSFFRCAILGAEIIACREVFGSAIEICGGLGSPHEYREPEDNEFMLSRACIDEEKAKAEVMRFKDWLVAIKRKSNYNLDGLEDLRD